MAQFTPLERAGMTILFTSANGGRIDLSEEVSLKSSALSVQFEIGKKFLVIDSPDKKDFLTWVLATMQSPIAAAPINPLVPEYEKIDKIQCLPKNEWVYSSTLNYDAPPIRKSVEKPLSECWAVIFSSGTSGKPKAVAISGHAFKNAAHKHKKHLSLAEATWLLQIPLFHIGGFSIASRSYFLHSPIAIAKDASDLAEIAAWAKSGLVEGFSIVPTLLHRFSTADFRGSKLKCVLLGGSNCPDELYEKGIKSGLPLLRTYGLTETCAQIATETAPYSKMQTLPGVELKISSENELLVRTDTLAMGYYSNGALSPLPLIDGFFQTGDIGNFSSIHLEVSARKTDLMITGGVNVYPQEIESKLIHISEIKDCAAFSVPDSEWGEKICLAVVARENFRLDLIENALKQTLDNRKHPKQVFIVTEIPRTPSGKILRKELSQRTSK
jgi:O-succinylbenzoic acid--CoA ligase